MKIKNLKFDNLTKIIKKGSFVLALMTSTLTFSSCDNNIPKEVIIPVITKQDVLDGATEIINDEHVEIKKAKLGDSINNNSVIKPEKNNKIKQEVIISNKVEKSQIKIVAFGDLLAHKGVYTSGKQDDGTYNFDYFFENIVDELDSADIKIINQETVLVENKSDYSGYPTFGSPYGIGESIVNAGFNVVLHATNHTFDKGVKGIKQTLSFWDNYKDKVLVLGIHESLEDYNEIKTIEVEGIKIAMLNYTYGLNGFKIPSDKQYLVDTLYNTKNIVEDIKKANEIADVVIVFPHWGTEYVYDETKYQKDLGLIMAEAGADIIIGAHPHVVEPLKYIVTTDKRRVPIYYSLGNFISSQDKMPRMLGAMAEIIITKENKKIDIDTKMKPIVTHNEKWGKKYTVYMLEDYTQELASKHLLRSDGLSLDSLNNLWNEIVEEKDKVKIKTMK